MIATIEGRRLDSAVAARRIGKSLHNQEEPSTRDKREVGSNREIREPVPAHCRELAAVEKDVGQVGREAEATATVGTASGDKEVERDIATQSVQLEDGAVHQGGVGDDALRVEIRVRLAERLLVEVTWQPAKVDVAGKG